MQAIEYQTRDWIDHIFHHSREQRWHALAEAAPYVKTAELASLFREVWDDSECIWRERAIISKLLKAIRNDGCEKWLFSPADQERFDALPDILKIYRGAKRWNPSGMSWTLDLKQAVFFASYHHNHGCRSTLRPPDVGFVMEKTVTKARVLFYHSGRDEDEIVLRRFEKGNLSSAGMLLLGEQ